MSVSVEVEDVSVDDEYVREEYARRQLGSGRHELEMLVHKTHEANQALLSTGVFKHLHTSVLPGSDQHKVRLVVHAQHKKWYGLHAGVEHNGADAFTGVKAKLNNLTGKCETWELDLKTSVQGSKEGRAALYLPRGILDKPCKIDISKDLVNYEDTSSYSEDSRGIGLTMPIDDHGKSKIGLNAEFRDIIPLNHSSRKASNQISFESLKSSSMKTALNYSIMHNRLDDPIAPTKGYFLSVSNELALPPGDVYFFKHVIIGKAYTPLPLFPSISIGLTCRTGFAKPINLFGKGSPSEILISDRFFLGGPLMMRGWNSRLVGPFSQGDSIGGDLFFAGGFHLTFPFPKLSKSGVRGHLFSNVGNVSQMKSGLENLFADSRLSVGVGLIIPLMNARLEINYVLPVLKQNTDSLNRFHWGIGLEFV